MMQVIQDLECFVMSMGEPTLGQCIGAIHKQTYQPARLEIIENVSPISASINIRHKRMKLKYSVKVDADMILDPNCFEILYVALQNKTPTYYGSSGTLLDPFIGEIGAVHMELTAFIKDVVVPNTIGCDRFVRQAMRKRGFCLYETWDVIGEHWCDYSVEAVFKRHMRVGQKHLHFRDKHHDDWIKRLGAKWVNGNSTAFIALLGYNYGLLTPNDKEKGEDFGDREWKIVKVLIKDKVIPNPTELYTLRK